MLVRYRVVSGPSERICGAAKSFCIEADSFCIDANSFGVEEDSFCADANSSGVEEDSFCIDANSFFRPDGIGCRAGWVIRCVDAAEIMGEARRRAPGFRTSVDVAGESSFKSWSSDDCGGRQGPGSVDAI